MSVESKIADRLSVPAVLEQLAEEAAELAQAALKYARILRGENPTPVTEQEAIANLRDEYADVQVCAAVIEANYGMIHPEIIDALRLGKMRRWLDRLEGKDGTNHR